MAAAEATGDALACSVADFAAAAIDSVVGLGAVSGTSTGIMPCLAQAGRDRLWPNVTDVSSLQPPHCFACGTQNPHGLHVHFSRTELGEASATWIPGPFHEGWPGIVHGGVIATILDEAMAYALWFNSYRAVTVRMETRFRRSVAAGEEVIVVARVTDAKRGLIDAAGRVSTTHGQLVAEATARFMEAEVSY